jgi:hypothetical protein
MIGLSLTPSVSNPKENVWILYSSLGELVGTFKSRNDLIEYSHQLELKKVRRIKRLEQIYSRYQNLSLYGVN